MEKTQQIDNKKKILVHSIIALIIAVVLAVGLVLGLDKSGYQNDNNQIEGRNYSGTSTQQNRVKFSDHYQSESFSSGPQDDDSIPPAASNVRLCHQVEVYFEILSENDFVQRQEKT